MRQGVARARVRAGACACERTCLSLRVCVCERAWRFLLAPRRAVPTVVGVGARAFACVHACVCVCASVCVFVRASARPCAGLAGARGRSGRGAQKSGAPGWGAGRCKISGALRFKTAALTLGHPTSASFRQMKKHVIKEYVYFISKIQLFFCKILIRSIVDS